MSDTIYTYEHTDAETAAANEYDERLAAFQGFGQCPYCGSPAGMVELLPSLFDDAPPYDYEVLYRYPGRDDAIYCECPHCETDASGYERMTHKEVERWLTSDGS